MAGAVKVAPRVGKQGRTIKPAGAEGAGAVVEIANPAGQPSGTEVEKASNDIAQAKEVAMQAEAASSVDSPKAALDLIKKAEPAQSPDTQETTQTPVASAAPTETGQAKQGISSEARTAVETKQPQGSNIEIPRSLGQGKTADLESLSKAIRLEKRLKGESFTEDQVLQEAHTRYIVFQTEDAMRGWRSGEALSNITNNSLFVETHRQVSAVKNQEADATGRPKDALFQEEIMRERLTAYFKDRDTLTTSLGEKYMDDRFQAEIMKEMIARITQQRVDAKERDYGKAVTEQAWREMADLKAEAMQGRPDGVPAEIANDPNFRLERADKMAKAEAAQRENGLPMTAQVAAQAEKEALTDHFLTALKERKTLLQILLELLQKMATPTLLIVISELKDQFEAMTAGK